MARLIDADEAVRMMKNSRTDNPCSHNNKTAPIWEIAHDCAISCVDACETVDAVPVVHGRWFAHHSHSYECTCCHAKYITMRAKDWNYCPNCGAKMDGGN